MNEDSTDGASQERYQQAAVPTGGGNGCNHVVQQNKLLLNWSSGNAEQLRSKSFCNCRVLYAEAINVDNASFTELRSPNPPTLTGSVACDHCKSLMLTFVIWIRQSRSISLMDVIVIWPSQGEERWMCIRRGELQYNFSWTNASCDVISRRRFEARLNSAYFFSNILFKALLVKRGVPSSVASSGFTWTN